MPHLSPAPHPCEAKNPARVERSRLGGYFEAFHTPSGTLAKARAAVLERTGYQTLIEEATDGWMVHARPTETLDPNGGEAA